MLPEGYGSVRTRRTEGAALVRQRAHERERGGHLADRQFDPVDGRDPPGLGSRPQGGHVAVRAGSGVAGHHDPDAPARRVRRAGRRGCRRRCRRRGRPAPAGHGLALARARRRGRPRRGSAGWRWAVVQPRRRPSPRWRWRRRAAAPCVRTSARPGRRLRSRAGSSAGCPECRPGTSRRGRRDRAAARTSPSTVPAACSIWPTRPSMTRWSAPGRLTRATDRPASCSSYSRVAVAVAKASPNSVAWLGLPVLRLGGGRGQGVTPDLRQRTTAEDHPDGQGEEDRDERDDVLAERDQRNSPCR